MVHRDHLAQAQVRIRVFDQRVEVFSPGRLLNSISLETLRRGCHRVRNAVLFTHLSRLRLASAAGIGVPNMFQLMRAAGLPEPEISVVADELRVSFALVGSPA